MGIDTLKKLQGKLEYSSILNRKYKVSLQVIVDILLSFGCFSAALMLGGVSQRLVADPVIFPSMIISILSGLVAFASFGLYRSLVRFITGDILIIITKGALISSSVLTLTIVMTDVNVPLTIPFIYLLLLFLSIGGTRFAVRQLFRNTNQIEKKTSFNIRSGCGRQRA